MPGGGTKLGTIPNNSQAFCLDVTRLVRRSGRVLTGVDRVEWAYLQWMLTLDRPVFGLMRSAFGYLVLDRVGLALLERNVRDATWPAPDLLSRAARGLNGARRGAETAMRQHSVQRVTPLRLASALRRTLPDGYVYLNTGHSNLTPRVLSAVRKTGGRVVVLVHDMIPLTHPHYQKPGTVAAFETKMRTVSKYADDLICNSAETQRQTAEIMSGFGRMPPSLVAHLGVTLAAPGPFAPDVQAPYVITVGTIEPRKNHALLLDLWETWAQSKAAPDLVICGMRGWNNDAVFAQLDDMKARGLPVHEFNDLDDGQMLRLVQGASAAVFPSYAEGFGLPQIEAAVLGVPLICGDLDIYKEILGDLPVYVDVSDPYSWQHAVEKAVRSDTGNRTGADIQTPRYQVPTWDDHFNGVLKHFG